VEKRTIDDGGLHAGRAKEVGAGEAGDVLGHLEEALGARWRLGRAPRAPGCAHGRSWQSSPPAPGGSPPAGWDLMNQ
jgi:hypothetical protein